MGYFDYCCNILSRETPHQFALIPSFLIGMDDNASLSTTIFITYNHVLGNIHQTTCKVTGVGCTQSRIHQALTSPVGRDYIFCNCQAFTKVCPNRQVNNFSLRIGHQSTHPHQLSHLGHVSPGAGVGHHPDRVQGIMFRERPLDSLNKTLIGFCPRINHFCMPLHLCNLSQPVTLFCTGNFFLSFIEKDFLVFRNSQVIHGDGNSRLGRIVKTKIFQLIGNGRCGRSAKLLVSPSNEIA